MIKYTLFCILLFYCVIHSIEALPEGFTYLSDVDPTIIQEIRYSGYHNFVGRPIDGYRANKCILTIKAAKQLSEVQNKLKDLNLSLKVYDCYRPLDADNHFIRWARDLNDTLMKEEFYPYVDKSKLFEDGYIAANSSHGRGSTVDLTIVNRSSLYQPPYTPGDKLYPCTSKDRYKDNSLDFGTGYDCFDPLSHTLNPKIPEEILERRKAFVQIMKESGFRNYQLEWWHYTLIDEPFKRNFNFPVE